MNWKKGKFISKTILESFSMLWDHSAQNEEQKNLMESRRPNEQFSLIKVDGERIFSISLGNTDEKQKDSLVQTVVSHQ